MNKQLNPSVRAWRRALITASAGALITISNTSCGVGGLFSKNDDKDSARVASAEPEKKRKRGSLFNRAKERNSYINDDIQTTRRDRYAAQNTATFAPAPMPTPTPAAAPTVATRRNDDFAPAPLAPSNDLELDPAPTFDRRPTMSNNSGHPEETLRLPTLDSDFPQQNSLPTPEVAPRTNNNGYVPLQPRLPGVESIQPPTE